jgi:PAS domain S-box-containing protein
VQDGQILYANPRAASVLGYSIEELLTRHTTDFYADPEDRTLMLGHLALHKKLQNYEIPFRRQDGSELWTSLVVTPLTFAGQQALFTAVQDITEQRTAAQALKEYSGRLEEMVQARTHELRQSNQQLVEAKNAAEAANQSKTVFLANVSHELRTPLNAILGFTQLLQRSDGVVDEDQEYLEIIYQSGRHLLNLINDVLEMSKIEAGQMVVNKTQVDLHQLLNSLRSMFTSKAESKGLTLMVQYTEDVPQYIFSDERKLTQILINLLNNGLKFTHMGYVALNVTSQQDGESGVRLRFEVRDTGVGISAQEQALLFRPFTQASGGQQAQEGTGLGLSLSQQLVRLLGGEMTLESRVGQGSVFSFTLRVEQIAPSEQGINLVAEMPQVIGLAPDQPAYRVLVVEDRRENRLLLTALLGAVGFVVQTAVNGREGVQMAHEWRPHFILMDIRMPILDGYEATRQLKQELDPCPPIVAISAGAFDSERNQALSAGCDDFVPKPFHEEDLWRVLREHLGVQFIYADEPIADKDAPAPLSPDMLAELDGEWRAALYQAAVTADQQKMLHLIALIQADYPTTADHLTHLVRQFATRDLLALLEKYH